MKRGEVWWADLPPPAGHRPVLLLPRDEAYLIRSLVTVALLTTRIRDIPVEVPLGPTEGLPRACVVNLDTLVTIPRTALQRRLVTLSPEKLRAVDAAIHFALALRT